MLHGRGGQQVQATMAWTFGDAAIERQRGRGAGGDCIKRRALLAQLAGRLMLCWLAVCVCVLGAGSAVRAVRWTRGKGATPPCLMCRRGCRLSPPRCPAWCEVTGRDGGTPNRAKRGGRLGTVGRRWERGSRECGGAARASRKAGRRAQDAGKRAFVRRQRGREPAHAARWFVRSFVGSFARSLKRLAWALVVVEQSCTPTQAPRSLSGRYQYLEVGQPGFGSLQAGLQRPTARAWAGRKGVRLSLGGLGTVQKTGRERHQQPNGAGGSVDIGTDWVSLTSAELPLRSAENGLGRPFGGLLGLLGNLALFPRPCGPSLQGILHCWASQDQGFRMPVRGSTGGPARANGRPAPRAASTSIHPSIRAALSLALDWGPTWTRSPSRAMQQKPMG